MKEKLRRKRYICRGEFCSNNKKQKNVLDRMRLADTKTKMIQEEIQLIVRSKWPFDTQHRGRLVK